MSPTDRIQGFLKVHYRKGSKQVEFHYNKVRGKIKRKEKGARRTRVMEERIPELFLPSCELLEDSWNARVHKRFHSRGSDPPTHRQSAPPPHARARWPW